METKNFWLFFLMFSTLTFSQNLSVNPNHPVYDFLNQLRVKNILTNYDDVVLPLTQGEIYNELLKVKDSLNELSESDKEKLNLFLRYFPSVRKVNNSFWGGDSLTLKQHFFSNQENFAYLYQDSLFTFTFAPIVTTKNILLDNSNEKGRTSFLVTYGGAFSLEYDDWFACYLEAWNGFHAGDRIASKTDQRVNQSYSFNHTGLNYFDQTSGYVTVKKNIFKLQFGRERILWGVNSYEQSILNSTPQIFDFIKFDISYKKFSYKFLHGWLVQPTTLSYIDSLRYDVKNRSPKYIVTSRFGVQPFENLSLGVGQTIIYGNRPVELAYLNPFLLWESAQRSLNDLDNSFLHFDARYRPWNGFEMNGTFTFDDINFNFLEKDKWNSAGNRIAWQLGFAAAVPFLSERLMVYGDHVQIRPYTYSHPNGGEALTYTNNGFPLGLDLQPNTAVTSFKLAYDFSAKLSSYFLLRHMIHGDNILDKGGNVIRNVGGSIFLSTRFFDPQVANFLDGEKVITDSYKMNLRYLVSYNLNIVLEGDYIRVAKVNNRSTTFFSSLQVNYNFY
ncbi:MAG: hypothetical protein COW85_00235 [Ignavibacteria bacterium CG22_combo_CG10-13_8_21_14_all_37_15]|nr:MAG: hypothetical protein COW85_00235 [Ignavibacteria bacterium CG22_combo_CG10-13_8_21_14_all_37_15]PJC59499.1 MAG: hypothetical protein CO025_05950 [Ignavibacteria bacterium CG_4_9_14_0_2_um_filter_37_13]